MAISCELEVRLVPLMERDRSRKLRHCKVTVGLREMLPEVNSHLQLSLGGLLPVFIPQACL